MVSNLNAYIAVSFVAGLATFAYAMSTERHFYTTAVFLLNSASTAVVMYNMLAACAVGFGVVMKSLFIGKLNPLEVETLWEKAWFALTESLLALTIFRDDLSFTFMFTFGCLLFLKVFHWMAMMRVDQMERTATTSIWAHTRLLVLMFSLFSLDYTVAMLMAGIVRDNGASSYVLFAFEFGILNISMLGVIFKYYLHIAEMRHSARMRRLRAQRRERERRDGGQAEAEAEVDEDDGRIIQWEEKGYYTFVVDIFTTFTTMVMYLVFFWFVFSTFGLPIHIIRDVYVVVRNFVVRLRGFIRYRRILRDMEGRFRTLSRADIEEMEGDVLCIVCRDEMDRAVQLPCGHYFHSHCLRSWLERQQSCPLCRTEVDTTGRARMEQQRRAPAQPQPQPQPQPEPRPAPLNVNAPAGVPAPAPPAGREGRDRQGGNEGREEEGRRSEGGSNGDQSGMVEADEDVRRMLEEWSMSREIAPSSPSPSTFASPSTLAPTSAGRERTAGDTSSMRGERRRYREEERKEEREGKEGRTTAPSSLFSPSSPFLSSVEGIARRGGSEKEEEAVEVAVGVKEEAASPFQLHTRRAEREGMHPFSITGMSTLPISTSAKQKIALDYASFLRRCAETIEDDARKHTFNEGA